MAREDSVLVKGGKTGYIDESQYNFVTRLESRDGKDVVVVVFGTKNREAEFTEAKQLADWSWSQGGAWPGVAGASTGK